MDASFEFSPAEVAARAGKDPWAIRTRFTSEVDVGAMGRAGDALLEAAREARGVKDLAVRADEIAQGAGAHNGTPMADAADRFDLTNVQLRDPQLDRAVESNFRAMQIADRTVTLVDAKVGGPAGLESRITGYEGEAQAEWSYWTSLRDSLNAQYGNSAMSPPPTVQYNGRSVTFGRLPSGELTLPTELPAMIRETYLSQAGDDARLTGDDMDNLIARYRRDLMDLATGLNNMGFDVSEGPLKNFVNPQMADFAAEQINAALRDGNATPADLDMYTGYLESIRREIHSEPTDRFGNPRGQLDPRDNAFLWNFYDRLTPESLGKLGQLDDTHDLAKTNVANGIQMLMNPEIGGMNPNGSAVPESIRHFVQDYRSSDLVQVGTPGLRDEVERFTGFGNVMSHATVASSDDFSKSLAYAATGLQQSNLAHYPGLSLNDAGSGMLQAAALNSGASAELLNEEAFRGDLLITGGRGAAALIESGAVIPDGMDPASPEAKPYVDAGFHVLTDAARYGDEAIAHAELAGVDGSHLRQAIGNTAIAHMDLIAMGGGGESKLWDPHVPVPTGGPQWGFTIGDEDRQKLFEMMHNDEATRSQFFGDVAEWQRETTLETFQNNPFGQGGGDYANMNAIRGAGEIQGVVAAVQGRDELALSQGITDTATYANYAATAAGAAFPVVGAATGTVSGWAKDHFQNEFGEQFADFAATRQAAGMYTVTQAAVDAGYSNFSAETHADSEALRGQSELPTERVQWFTNLAAGADGMGEVANAFNTGFDDGVRSVR
ncbi:hypothetical protein ACTWP5_20900 [Streptomyces sp. 4N509B]|uniref:hypothetical protein n=1 Tax=Streptomyces sp. 4N509B TaxID=3457413 RepID=UPI003FD356F8